MTGLVKEGGATAAAFRGKCMGRTAGLAPTETPDESGACQPTVHHARSRITVFSVTQWEHTGSQALDTVLK